MCISKSFIAQKLMIVTVDIRTGPLILGDGTSVPNQAVGLVNGLELGFGLDAILGCAVFLYTCRRSLLADTHRLGIGGSYCGEFSFQARVLQVTSDFLHRI